VPGTATAGLSALKTLVHEGGHCADFADKKPTSLAESQEEPPSSIAATETHSMTMDHLISTPVWLKRFAVDVNGQPMPDDMIEHMVLEHQAALAWTVRSMMVVPYFERALYSMPEKDLTKENILKLARKIEKKMLFTEGAARPALTVIHTHRSEMAGYTHGYVLAELAVWQTLRYLYKHLGHIVDNPKVGPLLEDKYYSQGNSMGFLELITNLTGEKFSSDAFAEYVNQTPSELKTWIAAQLKEETKIPRFTGAIDLNAQIIISDGDMTIAETSVTMTLEQAAQKFAQEIQRREEMALEETAQMFARELQRLKE
jgi:oligoendopeptidase F